MWSRRLTTLAFALVALSCGNGAGSGDGASAATWAERVCQAQSSFFTAVTRAEEDFTPTGADLQVDKDGLLQLLDRTISALDGYREEVEDAGEPDVENGSEVARAFVENVASRRDILDQARDDVADVPTDDRAAFDAAAGAVTSAIGTQFGELGAPVAALQASAELSEAFAREPACGGG